MEMGMEENREINDRADYTAECSDTAYPLQVGMDCLATELTQHREMAVSIF
jgi:hypothetical protein